ncbi:RNA ligase partner protein [Candidatus Roizmanbacteria bacterium RIFOXYB2_FULL_41_10]|uniref:RNA ligase partner protein n=1 Tax=Candidatus Roizmanbacteria bacterium RIFOXYA1_FULL_41_12 TaxID=1802082 RepID=A0A1F7KGS5_9BACT|nr:MAG: RNA ligase partner protein [Candidatus Roizmanbacteria bacterium RIFOXYA2_FULL_41_8]OGK67050.1 MAG: RNA ligase partner protein [Candidatus Roizmanbacteria bacterium RIFOXYA1_FULL_41_12]OGK71655.1 MAG: RNA ligase partner protein [Candidatus Roizmanbacteria bacterium RIFOXYC1_FULL_41_16]OGK72138.1 MAG: RNA ligase partner protein [Candidatus Roizmanbacteria bacterium RIFOXYB2_FULL_41_10]OGK75051.1 MAG: RNA ligase partner protein [Candidatus Roizmanbacteria bacterium RIFOXYD1_FULL_41_24]
MSQSFVLDTNFFINRQRPIDLGENIEQVVMNFANLTKPLVKAEKIVLLTTPDSFKELSSFFEDQPQTLDQLNNLLTISSYNRNQLQVSGSLFEELIAETGKRLYRGLRTAEEPLKELVGKPESLTAETLGQKVTQLRDKYRRATRENFIDSTTDLGLILLAKEKNAAIVSSDNGLLHWARNFGCSELLPEVLVKKLKSLS